MARVRDIELNEAPKEISLIYKNFIESYGPFANQAKVFAHRPIIFKHMMSMLMEMADNPIIDKRYLEIAIVSVSAVNRCDYCVAHHAPNLISEGLSEITIDNILEDDCPGLNRLDLLVRDYALQITKDHNRVQDKQFEELRKYFSEEQMVELTFRITLCTFFNKFNDVMQLEMEDNQLLYKVNNKIVNGLNKI